jgi:hypothetical protein
MYDKGFSDGATPSYKNFFYDTTTSDNTASLPLGLINIDTVYNDGGSSTLSLLGKDTYANASEFDGPAAYAL